MRNRFRPYILRDPNASDASGGNGAPAGPGVGSPGTGSDAGAGAGSGAPGSGSPAYASKADVDRLVHSIGGLTQKFDGHLQDYSSRFGARPGSGGDNANRPPEREPRVQDYPDTPEGVTKFLADHNSFHTSKNWSALQKADADKRSTEGMKAKRSSQLQSHLGRMADAQTRYKDFDTVVQNAPGALPDGSNGQPDVLSDVLESEFSADLQYQLSKNPGEYWKLIHSYNQSEKQGYAALKLMEARFASEKKERDKQRRQLRSQPTGVAGDDHDSGGQDEDAAHTDLARGAFGLNRKSKKE